MTVNVALTQLDDALLRLRRLWAGPPPETVVEESAAGPVTISSVLVVEVCSRADGEVSVADVARGLDVEHSTASRLVDRAVRAGLLVRGRQSEDARRVSLALTPSGATLRERAVAFRTERLRRVVQAWPADDVATLARLLARFADDTAHASTP